MESIANLENRIRDYINQPRKKHFLLMNSAQWTQLCSSMDVIGDTELAIDSYLENIDKPASTGELYILLYGILQVLFVQQDAVRHLSESLGLIFQPSRTLSTIREIRNNCTGHPTKREQGKGKDKWFNFITRASMSRNGFTLLSTYPNRNSNVKEVDVIQLISDQRIELKRILKDVIACLQMESMEHKNKYKDEKLADIFPQTLHYSYEKIAEAIWDNNQTALGSGMLDSVMDVVQKFRDALESRQIFDAYYVAEDFEWVEYVLSKLRQYFDGSGSNALNNKDAYIYLSFLRKQVERLNKIAKDLDADYEKED